MDINEIILNYASWQKRLLNFFLDLSFAGLLGLGLFLLLYKIDFEQSAIIFTKLNFHFETKIIKIDVDFYSYIIYFLYYILSEIIFKTTAGKIITRTVVIRQNGQKLRIQDALVRSLLRLVPFEQLSFFSNHPVGLHDTISNTRVINKISKEK